MKTASFALAAFSLLACLVLPFLFFWESLEESTFRTLFLLASIGWFAFATFYSLQSDPEAEAGRL